jgi:hypothetical protein
MTITTFNLTEAGRVIGKSRATIQRAIKSGKLSYQLDSQNQKYIEASELLRVFADEADFTRAALPGAGNKKGAPAESASRFDEKYEALQEKLVRQQQNEIERLEAALERAQQGQNKITALLEDQRAGDSQWKTSLERMATDVANLQKAHDTEIKQLKRLLHAQRDKSFWKRLFG